LKFTGPALAGIFSGKIKSWSDPELAKANPGLKLPANPIVVVHRSDASGSTYALSDYLFQVSPSWKQSIGRGATIHWPTGKEAKGNEALAELVKQTPNAIGYVELNYAIEQKLSYGAVQNAAGQFRKPTFEAIGASIGPEDKFPKDFRISLVNAASPEAYPICSLTWLLVPTEMPDAGKQKATKRFLNWAYTSGIKLAMSMDYGMLPPWLLERVKGQVESIQ
jgi:phosphate transport system substrate-binding protein